MNKILYKPDPWNLPVWFMAGIMISTCVEGFLVFKEWTEPKTMELYLPMVGWPLLLLGEAIFYWVIRRKIRERKWVWLHLVFSLIAFVFLGIGFLLLIYHWLYPSIHDPADTIYYLLGNIRFYSFWSTFVIAHIFFIIVIVHSIRNRNQFPNDTHDFLSELPG